MHYSGLEVSHASGSLVDDQLQEVSAITDVDMSQKSGFSCQSKLKILLYGPTSIDPSAGGSQLRTLYKGKPASIPCTRQADHQPCTGSYLDSIWIGKRVNRETLVSTLSNCVWVTPDTKLSCLKNSEPSLSLWLTDEVVNGFLCVVSDQHPELGYFSTFFYTRLQSALQISSEVERHTELTRLCRWMHPNKGKRNLKGEYFVPINIDNYHYTFVHADLGPSIVSVSRVDSKASKRTAAAPTLTYYDSFCGKFQACLDDLEMFFQFMAGKDGYTQLQCCWQKKYGKSPVQHDTVNCGLFVCAGIDCLSSGRCPQGYGSANMSAFRDELWKLFTEAGIGIQS